MMMSRKRTHVTSVCCPAMRVSAEIHSSAPDVSVGVMIYVQGSKALRTIYINTVNVSLRKTPYASSVAPPLNMTRTRFASVVPLDSTVNVEY